MKSHFVPQQYQGYGKSVIQPTAVQVKVSGLRSTTSETPNNGLPWDVTVDVTVSNTDGSTISYKARRYLNVVFAAVKDKTGFTFREASRYHHNQYNEHVVFNTAQARIRYVVEIELRNGFHQHY
ncbi:hypothetical protein PINS_up004519 [Pythium insidiosum]|nr:hypothetical protein PINS_up004519 [Pythium insidiosum]